MSSSLSLLPTLTVATAATSGGGVMMVIVCGAIVSCVLVVISRVVISGRVLGGFSMRVIGGVIVICGEIMCRIVVVSCDSVTFGHGDGVIVGSSERGIGQGLAFLKVREGEREGGGGREGEKERGEWVTECSYH